MTPIVQTIREQEPRCGLLFQTLNYVGFRVTGQNLESCPICPILIIVHESESRVKRLLMFCSREATEEGNGLEVGLSVT
jgi:hypothetical protein